MGLDIGLSPEMGSISVNIITEITEEDRDKM